MYLQPAIVNLNSILTEAKESLTLQEFMIMLRTHSLYLPTKILSVAIFCDIIS